MLYLKAIENETFNVRSFKDRRKKVNRIIVSYLDDTGAEYRKSFEFTKSTEFDKMRESIPLTINQ